ncbi:hypothetical protein M3J09_011032 [Ascochyta lentis]
MSCSLIHTTCCSTPRSGMSSPKVPCSIHFFTSCGEMVVEISRLCLVGVVVKEPDEEAWASGRGGGEGGGGVVWSLSVSWVVLWL